MSLGLSPAGKGEPEAGVNPPLPSPNRTVTFLLSELTTATSSLASPLRSARARLEGAAPTANRFASGLAAAEFCGCTLQPRATAAKHEERISSVFKTQR